MKDIFLEAYAKAEAEAFTAAVSKAKLPKLELPTLRISNLQLQNARNVRFSKHNGYGITGLINRFDWTYNNSGKDAKGNYKDLGKTVSAEAGDIFMFPGKHVADSGDANDTSDYLDGQAYLHESRGTCLLGDPLLNAFSGYKPTLHAMLAYKLKMGSGYFYGFAANFPYDDVESFNFGSGTCNKPLRGKSQLPEPWQRDIIEFVQSKTSLPILETKEGWIYSTHLNQFFAFRMEKSGFDEPLFWKPSNDKRNFVRWKLDKVGTRLTPIDSEISYRDFVTLSYYNDTLALYVPADRAGGRAVLRDQRRLKDHRGFTWEIIKKDSPKSRERAFVGDEFLLFNPRTKHYFQPQENPYLPNLTRDASASGLQFL